MHEDFCHVLDLSLDCISNEPSQSVPPGKRL